MITKTALSEIKFDLCKPNCHFNEKNVFPSNNNILS